MMGQFLSIHHDRKDLGHPLLERHPALEEVEVAFQRLNPPHQQGKYGLAVAVLEGHGDHVRRPLGPGRLRLGHGLHPDVNGPALERLHPVVQVEDFALREDDQHLPHSIHQVEVEPIRRIVLVVHFTEKAPRRWSHQWATPKPSLHASRFIMKNEEEPAPAPAAQGVATSKSFSSAWFGVRITPTPGANRPTLQGPLARKGPGAPIQGGPEVCLDDPDHPFPRLRRSKVGRSGNGSPPDDVQPPEEGRANRRPSTFTKSTGLVRCVSKPASLASWMSDSWP